MSRIQDIDRDVTVRCSTNRENGRDSYDCDVSGYTRRGREMSVQVEGLWNIDSRDQDLDSLSATPDGTLTVEIRGETSVSRVGGTLKLH